MTRCQQGLLRQVHFCCTPFVSLRVQETDGEADVSREFDHSKSYCRAKAILVLLFWFFFGPTY